MRRIILLPSGMSGINTAMRLKKQDHHCEINIILPSTITKPIKKGPFTAYLANRVTEGLVGKVEDRGIGCIEVAELGLDMASQQIIVQSKRGELPMRFTDLVMELEALPRIPRNLRNAENIFPWPCSLFYSDFAKLDSAVEKTTDAAPVVIIGGGLFAIEALGLALQSALAGGKDVCWIKTKNSGPEPYNPLSQDVWRYLLRQLAAFTNLTIVDWSESFPEKLVFEFEGNKISKVLNPELQPEFQSASSLKKEPNMVAGSSFIWADSLMVQHPFLGQAGLQLEKNGLVSVNVHGQVEDQSVYIMGSGANLRSLRLPLTTVKAGGTGIACPHEHNDAAAEVQSHFLTDRILSDQGSEHLFHWQGLGVQSVEVAKDLHVGRIGLGEAELQEAKLNYEYAVALIPLSDSDCLNSTTCTEAQLENPDQAAHGLMIRLLCAKVSGELLGAQFVSYNIGLEAEAVLALLIPMIRNGSTAKDLALMEVPGRAGKAIRTVAGMLVNKMSERFQSISPDELIASKEAGAEFFTLDLRPTHVWAKKHLPDAVNIPLNDLKRRLMTDVPRMMPIVLICEHSNDSYATACHLHSLGATDLYILDGGMALWPYEIA